MAKRHTEAVQHSSKDPNWRTPPTLFAALDREVCFVLDVAADRQNKLCGHYFGLDQDDETLRNGLQVDWAAYVDRYYPVDVMKNPLAVFMNPPYSKELKQPIAPWIRKAYEESLKGLVVYGVIPYSPQTEWWRRWVEGQVESELADDIGVLVTWSGHAATETRKIPHRVSFLRPDGTEEGNAGGNTAIVKWTPTWGRVGPWVPYAPYWSWK
jgi:phage N-6-adenine-methyltransferase